MPYIEDVDGVRGAIEAGAIVPRNVGELNFKLTRMLDTWLSDQDRGSQSYANLNEAIGILEDALTGPDRGPQDEIETDIAMMLDAFMKENPDISHRSIRAALRCAQLELYRRVVVPYEDIKRAAHGDVYNTLVP